MTTDTITTNLSTPGVLCASQHQRLISSPVGTLSLSNGVIRFTPDNGEAGVTINITDVTKIQQTRLILRLNTTQGNYLFAFHGWATNAFANASGSLIGYAVARSTDQQSGINDWLPALQQLRPDINVAATQLKAKLIGWSVAVVILILILLLPFLFLGS